MPTECVHCTTPRDIRCDNCGYPVCKTHTIFSNAYGFCSEKCKTEFNLVMVSMDD